MLSAPARYITQSRKNAGPEAPSQHNRTDNMNSEAALRLLDRGQPEVAPRRSPFACRSASEGEATRLPPRITAEDRPSRQRPLRVHIAADRVRQLAR